MFTHLKHKLLLCFVLLNLTACSIIKPKEQASAHHADIHTDAATLHDQHMAIIKNIQQFSLKGRLGVTSTPKSFSGRIGWQHTSENDHIDVFSPLGAKVANIIKTAVDVTLTNSKNELISAPDIETLTEETLGFKLPLDGLSYWALGRPSDSKLVEYVTWDNEGRIIELKQNGWDIQYDDYTMNDGYFLPRKTTLKSETLVIKLIVEKWARIKTP